MSEESKPCSGLWGRIFGHSFQPRYDERIDYPPNTMEGLRATLAAVIADPLHQAWDLIEKVCDGYQGMDINETVYVHDVCQRCGAIRERSVTISPQPQAAVIPPAAAAAPAGPQPSAVPQRVVAVPAKVVVMQQQQKLNAPPGAPGSPVTAVPGRGPK